ncbi:MAG: hypothetical protein AB4426_21765 [Xenococcaceae cyanobacterium]
MQLTDSLKNLLIETAEQLKGVARRRFMAQTVLELGRVGQSNAERELGWNRRTIRKGMSELKSGITCVDNYRARGRKSIENRLPRLLEELKTLVDGQSQTDPSFKSNRLYPRLSAQQVREQLTIQFGYTDEELPSSETIRVKLNQLGYRLKRVAKTKPQKKFLSKYNPIERTWAVRENHCHGSILSEIETVLRSASTMTCQGRNPVVKLVTKTYETGVKLTKKEMNKIENLIQRLTNLENSNFSDLGKWFVDIDGRTI